MTTEQRIACSNCGDSPQAGLDSFGVCVNCEFTCDRCNDNEDREVSEDIGGETWCAYCVSEYSTACVVCDERCEDEYVEYCEACDGGYCHSCYQYRHDCGNTDKEGIHSYGYKPENNSGLIFHGATPSNGWGGRGVAGFKGQRFMGVELEIDGGGVSGENARSLLELSDGERLFYIKADGSLDNGMEIVTHPATLAFHLTEFPWKEVTGKAASLGYKSHNAGTCGMHVHVSRNSLGGTLGARDHTISKLIILLWRHWPNAWRFSRRRTDRYCRQQYEDLKVSRQGLFDAKRRGRNTALNLEDQSGSRNMATIEFRLFRGSLKVDTIKATLQFVDVLIDYAMSNGVVQVTKSEWKDVIAGATQYPEMTAYLDYRGIGG